MVTTGIAVDLAPVKLRGRAVVDDGASGSGRDNPGGTGGDDTRGNGSGDANGTNRGISKPTAETSATNVGSGASTTLGTNGNSNMSTQQDPGENSSTKPEATKSSGSARSQPSSEQSQPRTETNAPQTSSSDSQQTSQHPTTPPVTSSQAAPPVSPTHLSTSNSDQDTNSTQQSSDPTSAPPSPVTEPPTPQVPGTPSPLQPPSAPTVTVPASTSEDQAENVGSGTSRPTPSRTNTDTVFPTPTLNATRCEPGSNSTVCLPTEFCAPVQFCLAKLADGRACDADIQCLSETCERNACASANANLPLIFGISSGVLVTFALVYALCRCGRFPWQRPPKDLEDDLGLPWDALHSARTLVARPSNASRTYGGMGSPSDAPSMLKTTPQRFQDDDAWDDNFSSAYPVLSSGSVHPNIGGYERGREAGAVFIPCSQPQTAFKSAISIQNAQPSLEAWNVPGLHLNETSTDGFGQVHEDMYDGCEHVNDEDYNGGKYPPNCAVYDERGGVLDDLRTPQSDHLSAVPGLKGSMDDDIYAGDTAKGGVDDTGKPMDFMNSIDDSEELNFAEYARNEAAKAAAAGEVAFATHGPASRGNWFTHVKPMGLGVVKDSALSEEERSAFTAGNGGSTSSGHPHARNGTAHFKSQPDDVVDLRLAPATRLQAFRDAVS